MNEPLQRLQPKANSLIARQLIQTLSVSINVEISTDNHLSRVTGKHPS